mmetsp:Transcript_31434/g.48056  ORF Transcript_31434/g.48056 Transcript_31434/m.48056 type:complete len:83 (-) Transcript_31434:233-481(-)
MPPADQIDQDMTKRSNSDIMNNYFIEIVARSFTDIEEILFQKFEKTEALKLESQLKEMGSLKLNWMRQVGEIMQHHFEKLER